MTTVRIEVNIKGDGVEAEHRAKVFLRYLQNHAADELLDGESFIGFASSDGEIFMQVSG